MNSIIRRTLLIISGLSLYISGIAGTIPTNHDRFISPNDFGLQQACTGEERYEALLKAHKAAIERGLYINYCGIDTIHIAIPQHAESIPLSEKNDFSGVVFNVTNKTNDFFLFYNVNEAKEIDLPAYSIDNSTFKEYPLLANGRKLLVVEDKIPWVKNRSGYTYGHTRKDILLLENGYALNTTIMPYNNSSSSVFCKYYNLDQKSRVHISNLTFVRTKESTAETYLCSIRGLNDVRLKNVRLKTPDTDMVNDLAILINDCTNVVFEDVMIDGTYSRLNHSGYGICMDNIWNFRAKRLIGKAKWGIFGNNNINTVTMEKCDINRFDIHCYGRDVVFKKCVFRDLYNQFSSVYGKIEFNKCEFIDFTPVMFEPSYNAYVKFDLKFKNCIVHSTASHNHLIYANGLKGNSTNERQELAKQEYPNLYIKGLKVIGNESYYIYSFEDKLLQWPDETIPNIKQLKRVVFETNENKLD